MSVVLGGAAVVGASALVATEVAAVSKEPVARKQTAQTAPAIQTKSAALVVSSVAAASSASVSAGAASVKKVADAPRVQAQETWAPITSSTNPFDVAAVKDRIHAAVTPDLRGGGGSMNLGGIIKALLKAVVLVIVQTQPAPIASDEVFVRRVTADALGRPATVAEVEAFVASTAKDKRARLVEALLASPELAPHWGKDILAAWLCAWRGSDLEKRCVSELETDRRLTDFVSDLILGDYGTSATGRAFEDRYQMAAEKSDRILETFAAQPTKCARCHDAQSHGITSDGDDPRWTLEQNYGLIASFTEREWEVSPRGKIVQPGFVLDGVKNAPAQPPLAKTLVPQWRKKSDYPNRGFDESEKILPFADSQNRRASFARAFTRSPKFFRATGHRIFGEVMDPLVDPNRMVAKSLSGVLAPNLLATCGTVLEQQGTLRGFLRVLLNSVVYQYRSDVNDAAAFLADEAKWGMNTDRGFGRRTLRRHHAETLRAALDAVAAHGKARGPLDAGFFETAFGYPTERTLVTERTDAVNPVQVLILMNSPAAQFDVSALAADVDAKKLSLDAAVRVLVRRVLGRAPTADELQTLVKTHATPTQEWLEDVTSALVTTPEFSVRR
jgi:hypothetical protein